MRGKCGILLSDDCLSLIHVGSLSSQFITRKLFLLKALVNGVVNVPAWDSEEVRG
jgi:hypothetical protein